MDFKKGRGDQKGGAGKGSPARSGRRQAGIDDDGTIDASPGDSPRIRPDGGARNIMETRAVKESSAGIKRMWQNYKNMLIANFRRMSRAEQEQLITRICVVVTIGSAVLVTMIFYNFLPQLLRVFLLPLVLGGAYWAGNKVVSPIMIVRWEQYLNKEY